MPPPIPQWSNTDKVAEALRRSKTYLPAQLHGQIDALLAPESLAIVVGTVVVWAGSHFFGVGEIVDVLLLLVGAFTIGWAIGDVAKNLYTFATKSVGAQSDADLDTAARAFAAAVVEGGITAVTAVLLHKSAKNIAATRGPSVMDAARPRNPGLPNVGRAPAGKPTVTGDPALPAGEGSTTAFGDIVYSTRGTPTEQQLVLLHEKVHAFFSPKAAPLRTFRARLNMSAYLRSALLQYLEEAMAETYAQVRVNGLAQFFTGVRFPVANGYVTITQLAAEGAAIGTIVAGGTQFRVYFFPAAPAGGNAGPR